MFLLSCCTFLPLASLTGLWLEKEGLSFFTIISVETGPSVGKGWDGGVPLHRVLESRPGWGRRAEVLLGSAENTRPQFALL